MENKDTFVSGSSSTGGEPPRNPVAPALSKGSLGGHGPLSDEFYNPQYDSEAAKAVITPDEAKQSAFAEVLCFLSNGMVMKVMLVVVVRINSC